MTYTANIIDKRADLKSSCTSEDTDDERALDLKVNGLGCVCVGGVESRPEKTLG